MKKTWNTPFKISRLKINLDNNLFVPVSKLNDLRRNALEAYSSKLINMNYKQIQKQTLPKVVPYNSKCANDSTTTLGHEISVLFNIFKPEFLKLNRNK